MTILGTQNVILEMLIGKDWLSIGEIKLNLLTKQEIKDEKILEKMARLAITELEKNDLIRIIDSDLIVLNRSLNSYPQTVQINGELAISVAKVLNAAAALVTGKEDNELCNALSISDKDIETLVFISEEIINNKQQNKFDEFHLPPNQ